MFGLYTSQHAFLPKYTGIDPKIPGAHCQNACQNLAVPLTLSVA